MGWTPDLVTVGKAIGSGIPIGAALVAEHVAKEIFAGDHGTTYGGNLLRHARGALCARRARKLWRRTSLNMGALFEQKLVRAAEEASRWSPRCAAPG